MIRTKFVSSLEKVFIDASIESYSELTHVSVLRGERLSFQLAHTYETKNSPMPYVAPKYMPTLTGALAE